MSDSDLESSTACATQNVRWEQLIIWLASHGMETTESHLKVKRKPTLGAGFGLFTSQKCPPSTPLFRIPANALINIKTLAPHYPSKPTLTAIQLISLHLFLHRPTRGKCSDLLFGPYISILPASFDSHPLTWLIRRELCQNPSPSEVRLLDYLPPSSTDALAKLENRFWADWKTVQEYVKTHFTAMKFPQRPGLTLAHIEGEDPDITSDFVWAWLNVNTRCIYHRIKSSPSHADNLTLCPILDFANHTATGPSMLPAPSFAEIWNVSPRGNIGDDFTLLSPPHIVVDAGKELYLTYGAHANRTLFVEYGFVNGFNEMESSGESYSGEVDIQDIVEDLFLRRGAVGLWMRNILECQGYWGDWTLHSSPKPAHPSYRVITALRLYHTLSESTYTVPLYEDETIQFWLDTLSGKRTIISEQNEMAWRETLSTICAGLIERAAARSQGIDLPSNDKEWAYWMQGNIQTLWEEENRVAIQVAQSLRNGEEF